MKLSAPGLVYASEARIYVCPAAANTAPHGPGTITGLMLDYTSTAPVCFSRLMMMRRRTVLRTA
eukprot:11962-Eustigmatos_ZCMA.PRE.1